MFKTYVVAAALALAVLLFVNMFVFPLVFGSGAPLPYSNLRAEPLIVLHALALFTTALLLVALCAQGLPSAQGGATVAGLAGLLASLPSALHTHAMVDTSLASQIAPIAWTVFTWGLAGSTVGSVLARAQAARSG